MFYLRSYAPIICETTGANFLEKLKCPNWQKKNIQIKKAYFKTNLDHLLCPVLSGMLFAILRIPENPTLFVLL